MRFLGSILFCAMIAFAPSPSFAVTVSAVPTTPGAWSGLGTTMLVTLGTGSGIWNAPAATHQGSVVNKYRSPFDGSDGAAQTGWETIWYYAVGPGAYNQPSPATLTYGVLQKSFSFLWGSLDAYNEIEFFDSNGSVFKLLSGNAMLGGVKLGIGAAYVTISDFLFNKVVFRSTTEALEFSNISSVAIPLPAALPLLGAGLGLLGLLGWRRKRIALTV